MCAQHITDAAAMMAETMKNAEVPMYGAEIRLPDRKEVIQILKDIRRVMFPAFYGDPSLMTLEPTAYISLLLERIEASLQRQISLVMPTDESVPRLAREIVGELPRIQKQLLLDIDAIFDGDPAASSKEEVIFAYPGLYAIYVYHVAHELYLRKIPMLPRMMSEYAHSRTGIDIHPGASIGDRFFIDHGTGIVIGETTEIGDRVKLYQGVTLGALSTRAGHNALPGKRHPTVENGATVYSNASILGGQTVVGENCVVGGNAFLTSSVRPNTKVIIHPPEASFRET